MSRGALAIVVNLITLPDRHTDTRTARVQAAHATSRAGCPAARQRPG